MKSLILSILIASVVTAGAGIATVRMDRACTHAEQWGDIPDLVVYAHRPAHAVPVSGDLPDLLVFADQTEGTEITFDYTDQWGDLPDMIVSVNAPEGVQLTKARAPVEHDES